MQGRTFIFELVPLRADNVHIVDKEVMFLSDNVESLVQAALGLGRRAGLGWGPCWLEVSVLLERKISGEEKRGKVVRCRFRQRTWRRGGGREGRTS